LNHVRRGAANALNLLPLSTALRTWPGLPTADAVANDPTQPPQSVGAVADRLLEINVPNEIFPNLSQNISRAARRDAVAVLVRGPVTLGRASSPSCQWKRH
jgi:hypothetical protein